MRLAGDLEANELLNEKSIDYTVSPYKLKDSFVIHCGAFIDLDTDKQYNFTPDTVKHIPELLAEADQLVFANGINYDYMVMKLYFGLDFSIEPDTLNGKSIILDDTMVMSKALNPDRWPGHSVAAWGSNLEFPKMNWRAEALKLGLIKKGAPKGAEFKTYHPRMLDYCKQDTLITKLTYEALLEEWGEWDWSEAYELEKKTIEVITRQEHRGFHFYKDKAEKVVKDLDEKMKTISAKVEPLIPPKKPTQVFMKEHSFPARPFLKGGKDASKSLLNFLDKKKEEATAIYDGEEIVGVHWLGKKYFKEDGKFPSGSIITEVPATLKDSTHIKEWLITKGWVPTDFKERDLTVDQKKNKISEEKFIKVVDRYINSTLYSNFSYFRCKHLGVNQTEESLRDKLLTHDRKKPLKVLTNPSFTIGQEKELCSDLVRLKKEFPYAEDVVHWLTYNHRRNSILGGGLEWGEEEEAEKGYLGQGRIYQDGRIATSADTCGCNTSRFKHRVVANIPRVSSFYGRPIRELFGADPILCYQLGYDFAGLEARIEAAYTYKYPGGRAYATSLIADKPHDIHTVNARKLGTSRDEAKTVKYALTYGSQPPSLAKSMGWTLARAKQVYNDFWLAAKPLKLLKERVEEYWESTGKKYILGIDGRKIPVRSKHSLLNTLFQSAGVICAKRAMILHEEKLKKEGLILDFFKDDWMSKSFAQQMIAYHDEAQMELTKNLVKIKAFKTEEEAEKWKEVTQERTKKILSNVNLINEKYCVGWSIVGETAVYAARESGEYYNLDVALDSDYVIGTNWAECH